MFSGSKGLRLLDLASVKAFADSAAELHGSDNGARIEIALFVWFAVKRFTKPITVAIQALVRGQKENTVVIENQGVLLRQHTDQLENHENRLDALEIKPKEII